MTTTSGRARAAAPAPLLLCTAMLWTAAAGQSPDGARPPASWQNPNLGVVADVVADAHDAAGPGSWRTEGLRVRAVEIDVSSNIDPHASLHVNVYVAAEVVELHEAYALFPYLPGGLKLKAGQMLPNFGRWSRFHGHFMPFAGEPRILHEYAGGGLLQTGAELSWLLPMNHFAEASLGIYNRIEGHSHDPDPPGAGGGLAAFAASLGCVPHGGHWDCPGGETLYDDDLAALAGGDGMDPQTRFSGRKLSELAYGARANTSLEFGPDWSLDAGTSAMFQPGHARSRRLHGKSYSKALLGADLTFFWHPLDRARYRGLDFGVEALLNVEESDEALDSATTREFRASRGGAFAHARWRHDARWHFGGFAEAFQSWSGASGDRYLKRRAGAFVTFNLTHYQYLRLEASRYEIGKDLDPIHRIMLQYDAVIGHHTHGVKR
jgi:hypothetical protein